MTWDGDEMLQVHVIMDLGLADCRCKMARVWAIRSWGYLRVEVIQLGYFWVGVKEYGFIEIQGFVWDGNKGVCNT